MMTRLLWVGLVSGMIAGIATAAIQHFTTTPLIIAAELYEQQSDATLNGAATFASGHADTARLILTHGTETHADGASAAWSPSDGLERTLATSVATIVITMGYGLMLLAAAVLADGRITARSGLAWGLAGFAATGLAPALGLSAELPGTAAAALLDRQIWWVGTALATATGLWSILRISTPFAIVGGVAMLLLPHIVGAPHPGTLTNQVPAELAASFASSALVVQAMSWALVGGIAGYFWERDEQRVVAA